MWNLSAWAAIAQYEKKGGVAMGGSVRVVTLALAAVLGSSLVISEASAMPVDRLASATNQIADGVQDVRWVCGPYRC
jgi:hypothetical protein